jgi:hypothetical protein
MGSQVLHLITLLALDSYLKSRLRRNGLTPEINNLSSTFDWSQSDVNVNSHIVLYLRPYYIISHNSRCGYIIGTLKYKFGLKSRWRMGKNGLRLINFFGCKRRKFTSGVYNLHKINSFVEVMASILFSLRVTKVNS